MHGIHSMHADVLIYADIYVYHICNIIADLTYSDRNIIFSFFYAEGLSNVTSK